MLGITKSTVATVLTVYGIETQHIHRPLSELYQLQQYLPFTVLKHNGGAINISVI